MKDTQLVVNLFAGPCVGKSVLAAKVFAALKIKGINAEIAREGVKDIIYDITPEDGSPMDQEKRAKAFADQQKIFEDQVEIQGRLRNKVDVIIAECPLLLSLTYNPNGGKEFEDQVYGEHDRYDNLNFFVDRVFDYKTEGRYQDEDGAKAVDQSVIDMLISSGERFTHIDPKEYQEIVDVVTKILAGDLTVADYQE